MLKTGCAATMIVGSMRKFSFVFDISEIDWSVFTFTREKPLALTISSLGPDGPECVLKYPSVTGC